MKTYETILQSAKLDEDNKEVLVKLDNPEEVAQKSYDLLIERITAEIEKPEYQDKSAAAVLEILNTHPEILVGIPYCPNVLQIDEVKEAING